MSGFRRDPHWPRWTQGPGAGGCWKASPDDFFVEELPLVPPEGEGEHRWLWVEKVGRTTIEVAEALAIAAGVGLEAVGYAGMKDREARTLQAFTVSGGSAAALSEETALGEGIRVLRHALTRRKLRVGELRGNRFVLTVREGDPGMARARAERLSRSGMPNYYGVQRTGGGAPGRGRAMLLGQAPAGAHAAAKFAISAYQSTLFNEVLFRRGGRRLAGDLLEDGVPTGPMYGHAMPWPGGEARSLEERVLAEERLPVDVWRRFPRWTQGARRPLWIRVAPRVEPLAGGFRIDVELPAGSYATVLLEELL